MRLYLFLAKRWHGLVMIALSCLLLACGFHLRGADQLPAPLTTLQLVSPNSQTQFNSTLSAMLQAAGCKLVTASETAPKLTLSPLRYQQTNPGMSATNQAITFTYRSSLTATLSFQGKNIAQRTFNNTTQLTTNVQQIRTPNITDTMQQTLAQETIEQIYYWLTNPNTSSALMTSGSNDAN